MRVPFFACWPAGMQQAKQVDHLVSAMDILPTMIDAAGGAVPDSLDGKSLLPLITGANHEAVHEHLIWTGIHSRTWGFMKESILEPAGGERSRAPFAWAVVKDGCILRHVGTTPPGLYRDLPEGAAPATRLFRIEDDPAEARDLSGENPAMVKKLREIYQKESADFPPPYLTGIEKWEEITMD